MRSLIFLIVTASPALADPCNDLIDRVAQETAATVQERRPDFATFGTPAGVSLTFSCGAPQASSAGAQFRGEPLPEAFFSLLGQAGHAVTGIEPSVLEAAAHKAQDSASRLRHSNVDAAGARVTCSVSNSERGRLTLCAVIESGDRS